MNTIVGYTSERQREKKNVNKNIVVLRQYANKTVFIKFKQNANVPKIYNILSL